MSYLLHVLRTPPTNPRQLMHRRLAIIGPTCFLLGMAMEAFMIKTGFYRIVTTKEAERRLDLYTSNADYAKYRAERKEKMDKQHDHDVMAASSATQGTGLGVVAASTTAK